MRRVVPIVEGLTEVEHAEQQQEKQGQHQNKLDQRSARVVSAEATKQSPLYVGSSRFHGSLLDAPG
jgi:hypothetical protein